MRILIISPTQTGIGGIAQHVSGLAKYLKSMNYDVDIISSENTFTIPIKGLRNPSFMLSSYLKTKFKKKYDIVHAHNVPAALAMKNIYGKKVLTLHGVFSRQIDEIHGKTTGTISEKYERDALGWADIVTVISKEAFDFYSKMVTNIKQVPNAIDVKSLPQNVDRLYEKQIIFAGRLSKEKGIDTLVKIARMLPTDIHLIVLGSGPEEAKMRDLAEIQNNVHFLGYKSKEKTISLIRGSDILIQPSLAEGISTTILEAMACGTAVVASNVGGNGEVIKNGITGFLFDPHNYEEFVRKITELLSDKKNTISIINNAKSEVEKYDWSHVGKLYLDIYESVLDQSKYQRSDRQL
ncbi:glycosyltransferase family 4 protein [Candidatus Nitrosotenuis uzonensis]|uniref:Glycosyl transferases group 1 n=1 Tax=Candidatus Nitrosotenuis uzonensis TaxID=1407055 RepID=V6AVA2_9ARCH|nr:glycosyltransferase family 4 protein [Candidatus Nitrosotenuis uzonensis]CDI06492.1 putative glycosyl transferases group 1 [Candidatus Nitrosotenuis uzonensis]